MQAFPADPSELAFFQKFTEALRLPFENLSVVEENVRYNALQFTVGNVVFQFRVARQTQTKSGHFVVFWKRSVSSQSVPYDVEDAFDVFLIFASSWDDVLQKDRYGYFVFTKAVLREHGVISYHGVGGKRGLRVYAPWEVAGNHQAQRTQEWQIKSFFEVVSGNVTEGDRLRAFCGL